MREAQITHNLKLREDGRLFSIKTGEEFIPAKSTQWIGFRVKIDGHTKYVHTLVLELFGSPKPEGNYRAWHKNRDEYDNRLDNLEWVTVKYASSHRKDALPVGQRSCDYASRSEYYCANTKRYQKNNKEKIKLNTKDKHNIKSNLDYHNNEEKRQRHKEACKRYYEAHKEEIREKSRIAHKKWYEKYKETYKLTRKRNKEKEAECSKRWRENNKEHLKLIRKINNERNKEQRQEYNRKWRAEHPEKIKEYKQREKEWYKEHPNYKKEYYIKKMSDPVYREHFYKRQNERVYIRRATDEEFHERELEYKHKQRKKARGPASEPL